MKVIDLLNKMENGKGIPNKIKLECVNNITKRNCVYKFNPLAENYVNTNGELLTDATCFGTLLHLEIEVIEEPKEELEELEEIELIDIHYINGKCIFRVDGKQIDETIALKVNELIENQNKIIREMKANKGNE